MQPLNPMDTVDEKSNRDCNRFLKNVDKPCKEKRLW